MNPAINLTIGLDSSKTILSVFKIKEFRTGRESGRGASVKWCKESTSNMGYLPRITLKQMGGASMALENQPVRFPELNENFELKSGLINLLPRLHGMLMARNLFKTKQDISTFRQVNRIK
ncbi:hypothetical protein PIB30_097546 [Stylosanthes scabra]|uniref:Uncharacterized protein n=1 Tax=Stylosanthes scabra TaxID=79078 RepID=A0ABU6VVD0_9FABA|nr:hypothetical protein [Stylosanthes scabra]